MWIPPFLATPEAVQHAASRHNSELYSAGRACVALTKLAATPQSVYSLAGRLVGSKSGYLLLEVPNALVRGAFDALHEPGAELPPDLNAHITVMRKDEIEQIGGLDKVTERGHTFKYQLGPIQTVNPSGWSEFNKCWFIRVRSPELEKLRKTYGLPAKPNNNEHDFHITIAVRKTTVIQENEVSKAADLRDMTEGDIADVLPIEQDSFPDPYDADTFKRRLQENTGIVDVDNDFIRGYALYRPVESRPGYNYVQSIAVHPEHRRKGVGTGLMKAINAKGNTTLDVRTSNEAAKKLYKRLGFKIEETKSGEEPSHHMAWQKASADLTKLSTGDLVGFVSGPSLSPDATDLDDPESQPITDRPDDIEGILDPSAEPADNEPKGSGRPATKWAADDIKELVRGYLASSEKQAASKLRSMVGVTQTPTGFDMTFAGRDIGGARGVVTPAGFRIQGLGIDEEKLKGLGLGKKLYGEMMRRSPNQTVLSAGSLSTDSTRLWKSVARRRPKLTTVNPAAIYRASGGMSLPVEHSTPEFPGVFKSSLPPAAKTAAADMQPELVIDRPKGFKKMFNTSKGKIEQTYPMDYGYFKGMINPQDKEDVDVFVGTGGPHHGRFMKGNMTTGVWKPDEHKWYHNLSDEELGSLVNWWEAPPSDPGLTRDWTPFADHTTLMADIKSRTEPAGSQKAARDLVLRAIEGRYGLEKTAGSEMKGLIDLEGVDDSILPHVKIHGDMEHTYSNGVPCTGKKITASRGSISKLSAATKPGYYSLLFNDRNAVVIFDDAVFHLPRADIRSSPRFEQALQHANSKDIPAFYMNELENTFWNDAPIKQAMLPSATTPWLPARLEIEKLKQQGVPVKGTGNLAASPEIRQQLADTLPAAHLQHIDPSKLEPELLAGMNRHPISKMMIDSSRPRGHIILGSNSKNPMLDMRNPNLVAPILQHEGDEARFAGTGQRVVSDTGNNLTELAAPGQTQMQRIGVASKLMQGGVAHNDPRILLNESHRIASGETHPAAARILEDARRSTGEYAFLHGLGIQYGKTPLPEGGRAYNKAIQRWAEKVPRTVSTNPYDPSRSLVYHDILPNLATKQKQEKAYLTKQLPGGGTSITPPNKYFPVGKAPGTITTPPIDKSLDDTLSELLKNPNVRKVMFPHRELPSLRTPPTPAAIGKAPGSLITPPPVPSPLTMPKQADEHIGHYKPKEKVTRQAFGYLPPKGDHDQFAQCGTCRAFTGPDHNTCMILGKEHVTADMSCNYYQHGNPSPSGAGKEHRVLTPKQAGLVDRQVRCENCAFFDKEGSYCELYEHLTASHPQQFNLDEHVDPKGCCNFQTPKGEKVEEEAKEAALWYLKDELSKEKEASANRISLTLIDRGQEKRSALSNNSAINIGAGVGGLALAATGGAMLYQGWNQPGQSWLEQGHQLWKEPENHDRLTEALGDHQSAQEMISMATIRPKVFQNLLAGQPQIGIDPEMQQRVRELTFGQNKEHMKSIPGDLMISGSRNGALGHLQPLATGSSAMHTDVGGIHGGDWLGLWTRWANHPKSTKAYFKDNPSIRVSPWDKAPADRYRIGLRPREDFAQPIDRKKLQQWLTSEKHPFGEQRFAEVAMNELLPEFKTQTGHSFGGIARLLAGNSSVKKMFAGSKMPQAYQKLIDQGYSPDHAAEVCSSFAARAIHKFNPKLIPGKYEDYSPHDIARLAEPGGPYKIHQMELPEKLMTPDELEAEHRRIKWGPLLGRLPIAAALLGGGGYLAHKAFSKSSAYRHGLKVVKVKRRDKEVLLCPHCGKEVEDKDLYRDAKGWVFHRPCFVKGKGSIKLSASLDNAAPAQRLRDIAATLSKRAFSGGLGSNPVSGMSATDPPRPTERDGSSQAAKVTLGGSLFDTMAGTSETQQPLDDVGVSYRTATPTSGQPSMAAGAQGRTAMASGAGQAYSNAPGSAALAAPSAGTSGQEDEIDEDLGDMNVDPESSTAAYGQIPHLDGPGGFVP